MDLKITLQHNGEEVSIPKGTKLLNLAENYRKDFRGPIVLAIVDGKLKELGRKLKKDCVVEFLDTTDKDGYRTYQRSLTLLFIKAVRDVYSSYGNEEVDIRVHFTINRGLYCEVLNSKDHPIDAGILDLVEERMHRLVAQDIKIRKTTETTSKAIRIFEKQGMTDKVKLLNFRSVSNTNIYELDGYFDYYYGYMVPTTGCLKSFKLYLHEQGVMVQYAARKEPDHVSEFNPDMKLYETQHTTSKWAELMEVTTIGELNDLIAAGNINELMLVSEALMEKKIAEIADMIKADDKNKKFIFIAGPSSSGKTTFAHRLAVQLKAHGMKPKTISVDNYFVNREDTPLDEDGNYNFETIEAIDVKSFNDDMLRLLDGERVDIPVFNFVSGFREYKGNYVELGDDGILVVEGIHGLNPALSYALPETNKFKIYISALTQLNLDYHNRIPTTDGRLLRRIVRDYQYRGASALKTISMWPSVRRGEEKYIFPFQEEADVMFNSALIYELAILKQYAEPLLFSIPKDRPEFIEAKRLIKFLDYILGVTSEHIPVNSLLREFVGGSCFRT